MESENIVTRLMMSDFTSHRNGVDFRFNLLELICKACGDQLNPPAVVNAVVNAVDKQYDEYLSFMPIYNNYVDSIKRHETGWIEIDTSYRDRYDHRIIVFVKKINDTITIRDNSWTLGDLMSHCVNIDSLENQNKINEILLKNNILINDDELTMHTDENNYFDDLDTFIQTILDINNINFA